MKNLRWAPAVFLGLLGCGSDPSSDPSGVNRDPDGVYVFGHEKWVLASNGEQPYGYFDIWTSSGNESLHLIPRAQFTGGETAQAMCEDLVDALEPSTVPLRAEPAQGAPGWWWFGTSSDGVTAVYHGCFIRAPQGVYLNLRREGGDMGRGRASSILASFKFL
jgi:hypothetical protein